MLKKKIFMTASYSIARATYNITTKQHRIYNNMSSQVYSVEHIQATNWYKSQQLYHKRVRQPEEKKTIKKKNEGAFIQVNNNLRNLSSWQIQKTLYEAHESSQHSLARVQLSNLKPTMRSRHLDESLEIAAALQFAASTRRYHYTYAATGPHYYNAAGNYVARAYCTFLHTFEACARALATRVWKRPPTHIYTDMELLCMLTHYTWGRCD